MDDIDDCNMLSATWPSKIHRQRVEHTYNVWLKHILEAAVKLDVKCKQYGRLLWIITLSTCDIDIDTAMWRAYCNINKEVCKMPISRYTLLALMDLAVYRKKLLAGLFRTLLPQPIAEELEYFHAVDVEICDIILEKTAAMNLEDAKSAAE